MRAGAGVCAHGAPGDERDAWRKLRAAEVFDSGRGDELDGEVSDGFRARPDAARGAELDEVGMEQGGEAGRIAADGGREQLLLKGEQVSGECEVRIDHGRHKTSGAKAPEVLFCDLLRHG